MNKEVHQLIALFQWLKISLPFSATIQMPPTTVQLEHYTAHL